MTYKGKTSSGHKVTFKVKNKRIRNLTAGIRMSCIPIQGGGRPTGGSEIFGFRGSLPLRRHNAYSFKAKPAFRYNEVTMKNDLWLKRRAKRRITGRLRLQYSFLIPKYPIGTFTIWRTPGGLEGYSCRVATGSAPPAGGNGGEQHVRWSYGAAVTWVRTSAFGVPARAGEASADAQTVLSRSS